MPASARGLCAATPLCARRRHRANVSAWGLPRHPAPVRGVAVISGCNFELSPPTRTMLLLPLLPSRETCPLPPRVGSCIPCRPTRGKRIRFASLGLPLVFHAPSLSCASVPRRRAFVELVGASHEGGTRSPVAASALWAKRRHQRQDCVGCRRKHGAVMVFR